MIKLKREENQFENANFADCERKGGIISGVETSARFYLSADSTNREITPGFTHQHLYQETNLLRFGADPPP